MWHTQHPAFATPVWLIIIKINIARHRVVQGLPGPYRQEQVSPSSFSTLQCTNTINCLWLIIKINIARLEWTDTNKYHQTVFQHSCRMLALLLFKHSDCVNMASHANLDPMPQQVEGPWKHEMVSSTSRSRAVLQWPLAVAAATTWGINETRSGIPLELLSVMHAHTRKSVTREHWGMPPAIPRSKTNVSMCNWYLQEAAQPVLYDNLTSAQNSETSILLPVTVCSLWRCWQKLPLFTIWIMYVCTDRLMPASEKLTLCAESPRVCPGDQTLWNYQKICPTFEETAITLVCLPMFDNKPATTVIYNPKVDQTI